jgi:ribosome-associated protein
LSSFCFDGAKVQHIWDIPKHFGIFFFPKTYFFSFFSFFQVKIFGYTENQVYLSYVIYRTLFSIFKIGIIKRMNETTTLIEKIIEGIQEKKGKQIVVADLNEIEDTICKYFIICQGNSPSQVLAIVDSIKEHVRKETGTKAYAIDGQRNAQWVAMDYSDVIVHIFLPEVRHFYNLEHLWADAKLTDIPDLD